MYFEKRKESLSHWTRRLANLVAAEGHPPEVMAQSFSNQILSVLYILKNHKKMENKIINVQEIDNSVDALKNGC